MLDRHSLTDATANRVALSAADNIWDANGPGVNVEETVAGAATSLSLRATGGSIGQAGGVVEDVNDNAIDLNVDTESVAWARRWQQDNMDRIVNKVNMWASGDDL